jgi:hypothetical protein
MTVDYETSYTSSFEILKSAEEEGYIIPEDIIERLTYKKIGRPRKYPVGQTPKQLKDPGYFKKYYQNVTKPKSQTEKNNMMKYVAEQL